LTEADIAAGDERGFSSEIEDAAHVLTLPGRSEA
jgi:hypothetical protein